MNNQQPMQQQINMDPKTLPTLKCGCGGVVFTQGVVVKKISALISPNGQNQVIQIPVLICRRCNTVQGLETILDDDELQLLNTT